MNAPVNPQVFLIEVEELRRERDAARVAEASVRLDLARALSREKALISSIRRLYGEARGEISRTSRRRSPR